MSFFARLCSVFLLLFMLPLSAGAVVINEIRIDQPGPDRDEYFELAGHPGESLDGLSYLVIGDSSRGGSGVIEAVVDLSGYRIAADGFFLVAERSFSLGAVVDFSTRLNFENNDNVTHLLVSGFSGDSGEDLDGNDDGVLDRAAWSLSLDALGLVASTGAGDRLYSAAVIGPDEGVVPEHVFRSPDRSGAWQIGSGSFDTDTPGAANTSLKVVDVISPPTWMLFALGFAVLLLVEPRRTQKSMR